MLFSCFYPCTFCRKSRIYSCKYSVVAVALVCWPLTFLRPCIVTDAPVTSRHVTYVVNESRHNLCIFIALLSCRALLRLYPTRVRLRELTRLKSRFIIIFHQIANVSQMTKNTI